MTKTSFNAIGEHLDGGITIRKTVYVALAALILIATLATGYLLANSSGEETEENNLFTYNLSVGGKTFTVTVETNSTKAPNVEIPESDPIKYVIIYFNGGSPNTLFFNATIPTNLLGGNLSLVWKYYLQEPNRYMLSSNNTHNSVYMKFEYDPFMSGRGYFEIRGTEAAW